MNKDLCIKKYCRIVSKKMTSNGNNLNGWIRAILEARKQLGLQGFVTCKKGTNYYTFAKKWYATFINCYRLFFDNPTLLQKKYQIRGKEDHDF